MQCPKCRGTTRPVRARRGDPATGEAPIPTGDIELDRCGTCHGTWYDRRELDALLGHDVSTDLGGHRRHDSRRTACSRCGAPVTEAGPTCPGCGAPAAAECPRCARGLEAVRVAGIELDLCPGCGGLWLDQSEALALAAVFDLRPAPSTGIACGRCGRTRLRATEVLCTEEGFLCGACHSADAAGPPARAGGEATLDSGRAALAADLLLNLVGSCLDCCP